MLTTQLLSLGLRKIRQPRVIAEVIGGIILGPTAFGRIPGFTEHIFPLDSRPYLSLVANIGLCLFLFLVGLEIDSAVIKRNARLSAAVALAGMIIPFGLGAGLSVALYKEFIDKSVHFTHFMLFTGVAYSITAFPVLCRILTELKLLDTTVGIVVLSAGVGNDIIGWTLLALSVALVNAGSGLMALWILLTCVGWTLFLLLPVKFSLHWIARRTGSIENGPTMFFMTVTILILFGSAFMTDIIGVHAIFGAFLAGIIVPRDGGLAIALTEKLEDIASIVFLPLYFTLSGLSTDLGLLNNGITWGYTVAICALAYFGKFGGCTVAARLSGFSWRESSTIGSLMSCKGLVELIVLNVGLSAHILSPRVFSMFVLEALLLTFMTTPAVVFLYPPELRVRVAATGSNFANVPGEVADGESRPGTSRRRRGVDDDDDEKKERFLVVLDRLEHLPGMMALAQLIQSPPVYSEDDPLPLGTDEGSSDNGSKKRKSIESVVPHQSNLSLSTLRLIELTDRTSAIMKYSSFSAETLIHTDPLLAIFRAFLGLMGSEGSVGSDVRMVSYEELAPTVKEEAKRQGSQMVLLPWMPASQQIQLPNEAHQSNEPQATPRNVINNPFEGLFRVAAASSNTSGVGTSASALHSHFIRNVFANNYVDVALYVDQDQQSRSDSSPLARSISGGRQHIFLPFFGGPDDRLAIQFVAQICATNPRVSATVVRFIKKEDVPEEERIEKPEPSHTRDEQNRDLNTLTIASANQTVFPDTMYGQANTETRLQSETADSITWARYAQPTSEPPVPRMQFETISGPEPLHSVVTYVTTLLADLSQTKRPESSHPKLLVVCGRSRRLAVENHHTELRKVMEDHGTSTHGAEVKKTVGDVGAAIILSRCPASLTILQAASDI
ncbi:hypothetical protein QCA50_015367 [Cerrena zonata]|uniref:Cation/H+ exchanger transmembrane domain-containing protein n=1 Tax=Cerrena zonata TaxID=2478898 RepID=A0AAW0FVN1_9APHY